MTVPPLLVALLAVPAFATPLDIESASIYAFTGSQAAVHAVRMPSRAGNVDAQFSVLLDGNNYLQWFSQNGLLTAVVRAS